MKTTKTKAITKSKGSGLGPLAGRRTITAASAQLLSQNITAPQHGLRRSSRGSRVWKKTILGEKFEYAEKLREKKNYILYVSGEGHEKKLLEEIEITPKPEPPKEKVIEVKEIIDNYGYHETKNVKKKNPKRLSITHHERLSSPFERTTLKRFSSYTSDPKMRRYVSTSVQKTRVDTEPGIKDTTINQYNSMTAKQQKNKTTVPPKLYETYKPAKTQNTKTTRTVTTENKAPTTNLFQPRNKITTQPQIIKTKTEITKVKDRRANQPMPQSQPKIDYNKYNRQIPADLGKNQTKTETHQDGEYVVKVTTTRTQIGKYMKPGEVQRSGSAPKSGLRPRNEDNIQDKRRSGPKPDFEPPRRPLGLGGPQRPYGPKEPQLPFPRMQVFLTSKTDETESEQSDESESSVDSEESQEKEEKPRYLERPHGPYGTYGTHGPAPKSTYGTRGLTAPHGPAPNSTYGTRGLTAPHGPAPNSTYGTHGFSRTPEKMPHSTYGTNVPKSQGQKPQGTYLTNVPKSQGPKPQGPYGTNVPKSQGPKPQGTYLTNVPKSQGPKPQGPYGTNVPKSQGPKPQGPYGTNVPKSQGPKPQGTYLTNVPKSQGPKPQEPYGTNVPKSQGPKPQGPYGTNVPKSQGPKPQGPYGTNVPKSQGSYGAHGPMPHGPYGTHGLIAPRGPVPHGPYGIYKPHGPREEIEEGRRSGSVPKGRNTFESRTYQVKTEIKTENKTLPKERTLTPRRFGGPHHMPQGPHGFTVPHHGPHGLTGPQYGPHGSYREERVLTEGDIKKDRKDKITGMSQYRFQQTTTRSDNGDNYEYFESKHIVETGRKSQPLTIHHRRGEIGGYETSEIKKDNRSSSYNKTMTQRPTQTQTRSSSEIKKDNRSSSYNKTMTQTQTRNTFQPKKDNRSSSYNKTMTQRQTQTQPQSRSTYQAKKDNQSSTYNKTITQRQTQTETRNTYQAKKDNLSSPDYKTSAQRQTQTQPQARSNRSSGGAGMVTTKYTQKTTTYQSIQKSEGPKPDALNEYKRYTQKDTKGFESSTRNKFEMSKNFTETKQREIQRGNEIQNLAFDDSEFEVIFCPVHGRQLVRKKKFQ